MNLRAVICDIYGTLLEVGLPPPDAAARWDLLWEDRLRTAPRLSLEQFSAACDRVIAADHAAARARGIPYPEVYWPAVVSAVLPEFAHLADPERSEFRFYQAQMAHTVRLMPGAGDALRAWRHGVQALGLASNAQPYTVRELEMALTGAGLSRNLFSPSLCFLSFEHGFSKPDPHVFQMLAARLRALGIAAEETLMVGYRWDHDIEPARACGWQTWQLTTDGEGTDSGPWPALRRRLNLG